MSTTTHYFKIIGLLSLFLIGGCAAQQRAPSYPLGPKNTPIRGCFQDYGRNLSFATEARILELCNTARQQAQISLAVVTIPSLGTMPIESYATAIGNEWAKKDDFRGNGVIVLLSFSDRQIRIHLDDRAARRMSDEKAKSIIQTAFIPRFRQGEIDLGTTEGVQAIVDWYRVH